MTNEIAIPIVVPGGTTIGGRHTIVIIGPNGVGKTRLGVSLAKQNGAERVAALRNIEITEVPMMRFAQASQEVKSALSQVMGSHWRQSFELQNLLSEILAEDRDCAVKYRDEREQSVDAKPEEHLTNTRLRKITGLWNRHFPGRLIQLDYDPKVERTTPSGKEQYSIARMSEGERTALYLAARIVSCTSPIVIVDEPETFFHPVLARALWNDFEEAATGVRFVYITHDIPFALSRRGAQFAIARSENSIELLQPTAGLPASVVADVLGAASFSISASRIIFCEGVPDSLDTPLLTAWHDCPKTAVVAVGSCEAVRECVAVFQAGKVTSGVEANGYIDRDGWPDKKLGAVASIKAHPVSEIEGLICIEGVFVALGGYFGLDLDEAKKRYAKFLEKARAQFTGVLLYKEILNRAKKRVEWEQISLLNPIKPHEDLNVLRGQFESAIPSGDWQSYLSASFSEEEQRLKDSLAGTAEEFLRDFPSKSYYGLAVDQLGSKSDVLVKTMRLALQLSDKKAETEGRLKALRDALTSVLEAHLWPRRIG